MRHLACLLLAATVAGSTAAAQEGDAQAIRAVIEQAYVKGVFVDRNPAAVRAGFHPSFVMAVQTGDTVISATLEMWLDRMKLDGTPARHTIRHVFQQVDVTGPSAAVKMQIWIDGTHTYTDYLSLYRFPGGWRIVGKIFTAHT